jgi:hypothetical protein
MSVRNGRKKLRLLVCSAMLMLALPAPVVASDLPCVWLDYNLPEAGSDYYGECSPVDRPPGMESSYTFTHDQPLVGSHYIWIRVGVYFPNL